MIVYLFIRYCYLLEPLLELTYTPLHSGQLLLTIHGQRLQKELGDSTELNYDARKAILAHFTSCTSMAQSQVMIS